jgi:hypothetical protein
MATKLGKLWVDQEAIDRYYMANPSKTPPTATSYKRGTQGVAAVTPDGQIVKQGDYSYRYDPSQYGYKIYQGPNGRLFRSWNPGIHGAKGPIDTNRYNMTGQAVQTSPENFRWEWSPQSDYKVWQGAQKAYAKMQAGAPAKTGGGTGAAGGATTGTGAQKIRVDSPVGAAAAAANAPPGTTTSTEHQFDYDKWLANEPTLQAALRNVQTGRTNLGTQLVGGVQQLYGRLGEAPSNLTGMFANLPQEVRDQLATSMPDLQAAIDAGNQAGTSAFSRLNADYRLGQSQDVNQLAGMGALRSGAYGQESAKNLRELQLGQYDKRLAATDALQTLQQSYLTGQGDLTDKASTALTDAQTRASNLIGLGQLGPYTTTSTVPNPYMPPKTGATAAAPKTDPGQLSPANVAYKPPTPAAPKAAPYKAPSLGFRALR